MHRGTATAVGALVVAAVVSAGCAPSLHSLSTGKIPVPDSPARPVAVAAPPAPVEEGSPGIPPDLLGRISSLTLAEVIDIALRNNDATRATWADARAAAANLGSTKSGYYPEVDLEAEISRVKQSAVGGLFSFQQTTYVPSVRLSYLLLDFGGRKGEVEKARQALVAADWTHNATIQTVVLRVEQSYYDYLNAKAQLDASAAGVKEAETNLDAATTRHDAGVATIADVLQAKTALSQAKLVRITAQGALSALLGSLVTAMGLPANTRIDVGVLPGEPPIERIDDEVEAYIERALASRPDLAAARATALQAESQIRVSRSQGLPTLDLTGTVDRTYYSAGGDSDNWSAAVLFSFPVFDGYRTHFETAKANEQARAARTRAGLLQQTIVLDVWTAYTDVTTAAQRVTTSRDLLASAEQSEQVALGRYKEGVGSIIELLTAQARLAVARAQEISARSDWFTAVARLAYASGTLGPMPGTPDPNGPPGPPESP